MSKPEPEPLFRMVDGRWHAIVGTAHGDRLLDLEEGDARIALAKMAFIDRGSEKAYDRARVVTDRMLELHPSLAESVAKLQRVTYDDLIRPNEFARWLRARERAA